MQHLPRVVAFCAKITDDNTASRELFQKRLGFSLHKHMAVFEQTELRLEATMDVRERLCVAWAQAGAQEQHLPADC